MLKRFHTIPELARVLNVSRTTMYNWINAGELVVTRLSAGTVRIADDDLEAFIRSRAERAAREAEAKRAAAANIVKPLPKKRGRPRKVHVEHPATASATV